MEENQIPISELPFNFDKVKHIYGSIRSAELYCPGAYYIFTQFSHIELFRGTEYLVAAKDCPALSPKARAYGLPLLGNPRFLIYDCDDYFNQGKFVAMYEIYQYLTAHGLPIPAYTTLEETKLWGMEVCPEYFGEFPIPTETPWGPPLRHSYLWNGLYWLETKQAGWALTIAYPLCEDLTYKTKRLGQQTDYDLEHGIDNTYGFRFYTYRSSCLPVFELLQYADETWESKINVGALKNAILKFHPDYAEDTPCIPPDMELIMSPGAGFDFYAFPQEP